MTSTDLQAELQARGGVLKGHFQLSSGRHADTYLEKFRILQWPDITSEMCRRIAEHFRGSTNLVAGPTTGGVILAFEVARQLDVRNVIAERKEGGEGREFKRGFEVGANDRVLVVDDVLTTGGSIRDVIDAVRDRGAEVVGVGVLVDRSGGNVDFGVPFFSCLGMTVESWQPEECPECRAGTPLVVT